jgi:hypothetical protein
VKPLVTVASLAPRPALVTPTGPRAAPPVVVRAATPEEQQNEELRHQEQQTRETPMPRPKAATPSAPAPAPAAPVAAAPDKPRRKYTRRASDKPAASAAPTPPQSARFGIFDDGTVTVNLPTCQGVIGTDDARALLTFMQRLGVGAAAVE